MSERSEAEAAAGATLARDPIARPERRSKGLAGAAALVALLVLVDQIVKQVVERAMALGELIPVVGPLYWLHARNKGIAFSWLSGVGAWGLVGLSSLVLALMVFLFTRTPRAHRLARLGFILVIGGAIGNLIDRAMLGYVTDYVFLSWRGWSFAVFNLADAFITVGAIAVLADELLGWGRRSDRPPGSRDAAG